MQASVNAPQQPPSSRIEILRRYDVLAPPGDRTLDRVAELAAGIFGTPVATVGFVEEDRVRLAAAHGLDGVTELGADPGLCASAVLSDGPYVVRDALTDARTRDHPLVRGDFGLRFYAAAPVTVASGQRLGTVAVVDRRPRDDVPAEQTAMLTALAAIVAHHLDLRLEALTTVRGERDLRARAERHAAAAAQQVADTIARTEPSASGSPSPASCQLGGAVPCTRSPELKVADPWGDSAWGCIQHVEEALLSGSSVFVADESMSGLAAFLRRGRRA